MSRIDHTPGPWTARPRDAFYDGSQDEVSGLGWDVDGPPKPMLRGQFSRAADARLVASAPDMYQALLAVRDSLDTPFDNAAECCRVRLQVDAMVDEVLRPMESGGTPMPGRGGS